ncbi:MAG TPA: DUF4230 domain-containing protein [Anaerolineales bacterium]|jgi:hypothetical protein
MNDNRNLRAWVFVIGVLVIFALAAYAVVSVVRRSVQQAEQAVQPVTDLSNAVGTQMAQVLNPTPTVIVDPVTIVRQVRSLARLETIQYSVEKVITAESGQGPFGFLFGDRLLLVAHGEVIAGVDLSKLSPDDLRVRDNVLYVSLPEPEIFVATLDNEQTYVYDRETGILTQRDINLESTARQAAEQAIREAALEDNILNQARVNAENYLHRLFIDIGNYDEVIFVGGTPQP